VTHAGVSAEPDHVVIDDNALSPAAALRKALEAAKTDPAPNTSRRRRSRERPNGAHRRPRIHPPPERSTR
jgi:hypothetical protein